MDVVEQVNPGLHCQLLIEEALGDYQWPERLIDFKLLDLDAAAWAITDSLHPKLREETAHRVPPLLFKVIVASLMHEIATVKQEEREEDDEDFARERYKSDLQDVFFAEANGYHEDVLAGHARALLKANGLRVVTLKGTKREIRKGRKRHLLPPPPSSRYAQTTSVMDAICLAIRAGWMPATPPDDGEDYDDFIVAPGLQHVLPESTIKDEAEEIIPFGSDEDAVELLLEEGYTQISANTELDALVYGIVRSASLRQRVRDSPRK